MREFVGRLAGCREIAFWNHPQKDKGIDEHGGDCVGLDSTLRDTQKDRRLGFVFQNQSGGLTGSPLALLAGVVC